LANRSVVFVRTRKKWGGDGERWGEELAAGGKRKAWRRAPRWCTIFICVETRHELKKD